MVMEESLRLEPHHHSHHHHHRPESLIAPPSHLLTSPSTPTPTSSSYTSSRRRRGGAVLNDNASPLDHQSEGFNVVVGGEDHHHSAHHQLLHHQPYTTTPAAATSPSSSSLGATGEGGEESQNQQGGKRTGGGSNRRPRSSTDGSTRRRGSIISNLPGASSLDVTTRLLIPSNRIGSVIGKGGEVIKGIREMTGARIHINSSNNEEQDDEIEERDSAYRLVSVTGPLTAVCWAVELVATQAGLFDAGATNRGHHHHEEEGEATASPVENGGIRMIIDASVTGQLIGKKGAVINEIRSTSQARIQVINDDDPQHSQGALPDERVVLIRGDVTQCRKAHQLINAALWADPHHQLTSMHHSNNGQYQQQQQQPSSPSGSSSFYSHQHQANLSSSSPFPTSTSPADDLLDSCEVIMRIPNEKIGRVIGKEGSVINKIRHDAQCRIEIENSRSGELAIRCVRIRGNMQQTQVAQQLITQKINTEPTTSTATSPTPMY